MLDYHDRLLRDPSPLTVEEREMIAAYVSALNACDFYHGAHVIAAGVYGIEESVIEALLADPETAPVEDRLKPILAHVGKLTKTPGRITPGMRSASMIPDGTSMRCSTRSASARSST